MSGKAFIDTNILVYAAIQAPDTNAKRLAAVAQSTMLKESCRFFHSL